MRPYTHFADGKPIGKSIQDEANYMRSGSPKTVITKDKFGCTMTGGARTEQPSVITSESFVDNVPLTDQRGGPVTKLQLKDAVAEVAAEAAAPRTTIGMKASNGDVFNLTIDNYGILSVTEED